MTRTADRTLLQTLGFDDPDRKNEEHDLACRFMVQPETMEKLTRLLWPDAPADLRGFDRHPPELIAEAPGYSQTGIMRREALQEVVRAFVGKGAIEKPIMRGGGYFVGFADAFVVPSWKWTGSLATYETRVVSPCGPDRSWAPWAEIRRETYSTTLSLASDPEREVWRCPKDVDRVEWSAMQHRECIGVEVKIGPTSIANCIKQIKLYDVHLPARWILATRYVVSKSDRDLLANEGITHIRLAGGFDDFLEKVRSSEQADSPEF